MTDTRQALHRAVLDNPADDLPRLALADHLDELGGKKNAARAELIRLQCGYYNRTGDTSAAQMDKVAAAVPRVEALLRKWGAGWVPGGPLFKNSATAFHARGEVVTSTSNACEHIFTFERGFVSRVRFFHLIGANAGDTLDHADAIRLVKALCHGHPVEVVQFEVAGADPVVRLRIERALDEWRADLDAADDAADFPRGTVFGSTVGEVQRAIPALLRCNLPHMRFQPIPIPF